MDQFIFKVRNSEKESSRKSKASSREKRSEEDTTYVYVRACAGEQKIRT